MGTSGTSGVSAAGTLKTYTVVIATVGGQLSSVTSATAPDGTSLIGVAGWTFTVAGVSQFTITHPLGNVITGASSNGVNGALVLTRPFSGLSTAQYTLFQNSTYTTMNFYSMVAANSGYASTGTASVTIYFFAKV